MNDLSSRNLSNVKLFESRLQSLHMFQVGCYLKIPSLVCSQKMVDNQLGIGMDVELLNPYVFGKVESGYKCLVFSFIICGFEATTYGLLDQIPLG